jgi:hypothetical protein
LQHGFGRGAAPDAGGWVPEGKRVLGVFVPLIEALTERKWGDNSPPRPVAVETVALFATPATVSSRAFQRELAFRAIGVDVEAQPCAGVVDAIEMGDMILADALVRSHVEALHPPDAQAAGRDPWLHPLPAGRRGVPRGAGPDVAVYSQPDLVAEGWPITLGGTPTRSGHGDAVEIPDLGRSEIGVEQGHAIPAPQDRVRGGGLLMHRPLCSGHAAIWRVPPDVSGG